MTIHPFLAEPPPRIQLSNAPLERVIAQIKFPGIHLDQRQGLSADFHDRIKTVFPISEIQNLVQIQWIPDGGEPRQVNAPANIFKYVSPDRAWELSLGEDFISLVALSYTTNEEFVDRFRLAVEAAGDTLDLKYWSRLGLRYINRNPKSESAGFNKYEDILKPEYRGVLGSNISEGLTSNLSVSEWTLDELVVSVRHAYLAQGTTYDPITIPHRNQDGWVLDIDVYRHPERFSKLEAFTPATIVSMLSNLVDREYSVFRKLVRDEFLIEFGGVI